MSRPAAILRLIRARARRRPGPVLFTVIGLTVATGFAGAVAAQSTIAGDRAARDVLRRLSPLERAVRITTSDVVGPSIESRARALLHTLGLRTQAEVALLNPVRLSGVVVRPAAIDPLGPWTTTRPPGGTCRPADCPVLLASGHVGPTSLTADGVRLSIAAHTALRSAAPLGFKPTQSAGQPPLVLTGDAHGLETIPALGGVFRTHSWLALLPTSGLHAWQLASTERALRTAEATLLAGTGGPSFSLTAPFGALDSARAQAAAAPRRLLLAGGGALAALVLFVALAVGGLRREVDAELVRLRNAGATSFQCALFVGAEAAVLCGAAVLAGALAAIAIAGLEAGAAGLPVSGVLTHSLLTPLGAVGLVGGWLLASLLTASLLLLRSPRIADALSLAAVAALILALARGGSGSRDPLPVLLAPLASLAAGVVVYRLASTMLQAGERMLRSGPVMPRLALVSLARSPAAPSLAIAFISVSIGLGAFALSYRATLERSTADQAADQVPLDATVSPGPDFTTPLEIASLARWHSISRGTVAAIRRTEASYVSGGSSVTLPALGVPAATLTKLHGWRSSDGSAPPATLARRLVPNGPVRIPGPELPAGARVIAARASSGGVGVTVTADLLGRGGVVRRVTLGRAQSRPTVLRAHVPQPGPWQLGALELSEPTGLEITSGHQNGENVAAATRFTGPMTIGSVAVDGVPLAISGWRTLGAARGGRPDHGGIGLRFAATGELGLVRPTQPSDLRPVPVLVDPATAAASGHGRRIALTVDGEPVSARVVGVLRRLPTIAGDASGFVVADEPTLASALDAQDPGQGQADELWISTSHAPGLRAALAAGRFAQLSAAFRTDVQHRLRAAPISSAVLATLTAATIVSGTLAVLGLMIALLGAARDERIERDLIAQGVGPRKLRAELRMRLVLAGAIGVVVGLAIGVLLTRLAVATVRSAGTVAVPRPPIVTVAPWAELAAWGVIAGAALTAVAWLATRMVVGREAS